MNTRKRVIGASAAFVMALSGVVAAAPAAFARSDPTGSLVDNFDGTATATYERGGGNIGIHFCNPSFSASDLSECNVDTSTYALSNDSSTLAASPALLEPGITTVHKVFGLPRDPLPDGYYTIVMVYQLVGRTEHYITGLKNVRIGNPGGIPMWLQAVGRHASDTCAAGWGPSWQSWAIPVTGGFVCMREVPAYG